ncbi:MAG: SH3 domain-containing protein [Shimia sp.]
MGRFMIVTLFFVGWGFYELSGGAEFEPPEVAAPALNTLQEIAREETRLAEAAIVEAQDDTVEIVGGAGTDAAPVEVAQAAAAPSLATVLGQAATAAVPTQAALLAEVPQADIRIVSGNRVNVRTGPGTNYQRVAQMVRGDETEVLSTLSGWAKIRTPDGNVGWMAARFLRK